MNVYHDWDFRTGLGPNGKGIRVAWLMPSVARGFYWQPIFREFTELFPETRIFAGFWPAALAGYEGSFSVRHFRVIRFVTLAYPQISRGLSFTWVPLSALCELAKFKPRIIFTTGFSLFTLYALLLKFFLHCRIVLLWEGIAPSIAFLNSPLRLSIRRLMAHCFDACISNTQEGLDYLRRTLGVPERKLICYPYEVSDIKVVESIQDAQTKHDFVTRPVFLYVGQLIGRKGLRNFLYACSHLKEQGKTHYSIVIVGEGSQGQELRELANTLGLGDQVHWAGRVAYEKLGSFYRACDIFVFPTLEDTWGLVVPEAMAFGKPILCSKYAGSKELIVHGENGYVFDARQPRELAELMARFVSDPGLADSLGARSKQIITPYTPRQSASVLASVGASHSIRKTTARRPYSEVGIPADTKPEMLTPDRKVEPR